MGLKPGKCVWGGRGCTGMHCPLLVFCSHSSSEHQGLPSTPSAEALLTKSDHLPLRLQTSPKQLHTLVSLRAPGVCNVRSFREEWGKKSDLVKRVPSHSPYLFISLSEISFTSRCRTTGILDSFSRLNVAYSL